MAVFKAGSPESAFLGGGGTMPQISTVQLVLLVNKRRTCKDEAILPRQ